MKNRINKLTYLILAVAFSFTACDTVDFGDLNVNPNSPSSPSSALLLSGAERAISGTVAATTANLYVQYLSNGQYDEESRYQTLNWGFNGYYATLVDLKLIQELNTNPDTQVAAQANGSNANQIAVAKILTAWYYQIMTDRWGMVPFTEALQGLDAQFPAFDSQQTIYNGIFNELDAALGMMDSGNGPSGDFLLGGDMAKWATFANTIKMVCALRLSKADPATGGAKFSQAMAGAIGSNADNIWYSYLSEENNDNLWQDRFETRRDYLMSAPFVDALIGTGTDTAPEDPRLAKYADPAFNFPGQFIGAPYGVSNSATDNYSFITSNIIGNGAAPLAIYTYAEVLFARSEAAALGWTAEDAVDLYNQAITASMEQWGVAAGDASAYVAANPWTAMTDIAYEKWVALYLQGYNAWSEYRRHHAMGYGVPLVAPADLLNNATGIPDRHGYSATASALNEDNYNAAISAQGPDALNTKLWTNQ